MMRTAYTLFRKDLLVEARTRESLTAMALFSVMAFVLFHFGLNRDAIDGDLAAGVLWVTLLLATVLAVTRLFVAEREQGGFESLLLAPIDRTAIFFGKGAALLVYLVLVEVVAIPAFDVLLLRGTVLDAMPELLAVIVLARVITRLGSLPDVDTGVIEGLFASDLAYLERLYETFNAGEEEEGGGRTLRRIAVVGEA